MGAIGHCWGFGMGFPRFITWAMLGGLMFLGAGTAVAAKMYRCDDGNGGIEFRQSVCTEGRQREVEVRDVKMGWDAPIPEVRIKEKDKPKNRARKASKSRAKTDQQCFKKQQQLESVNRKLRSGYKAGKGADLRHRRRQYEDYLSKFCR